MLERFNVDCQPAGSAHDSAMDALWPVEVVRQAIDSLDSLLPWNSSSVTKAHAHFQLDFPKAFVTRLEIAHIPKGAPWLPHPGCAVNADKYLACRLGICADHRLAGDVWHSAAS